MKSVVVVLVSWSERKRERGGVQTDACVLAVSRSCADVLVDGF